MKVESGFGMAISVFVFLCRLLVAQNLESHRQSGQGLTIY